MGTGAGAGAGCAGGGVGRLSGAGGIKGGGVCSSSSLSSSLLKVYSSLSAIWTSALTSCDTVSISAVISWSKFLSILPNEPFIFFPFARSIIALRCVFVSFWFFNTLDNIALTSERWKNDFKNASDKSFHLLTLANK